MKQTRTLIAMAESGSEYLDWYDRARTEIREVSRQARFDRRRFCDILALSSPRCAVRRNVRLGLHWMLHGEYPSGTMRTIRTATEHYERTGEIRGPKTRPFAEALYGSDSAIVIDSWMEYAVGVPTKASAKKATRAAIERRVCEVARTLGVENVQAQAAIWGHARESAGFAPIGFPVIEEFERTQGDTASPAPFT